MSKGHPTGLRPCWAKWDMYDGGRFITEVKISGWFHQFVIGDDGQVSALVELSDGSVVTFRADGERFRFTDTDTELL